MLPYQMECWGLKKDCTEKSPNLHLIWNWLGSENESDYFNFHWMKWKSRDGKIHQMPQSPRQFLVTSVSIIKTKCFSREYVIPFLIFAQNT